MSSSGGQLQEGLAKVSRRGPRRENFFGGKEMLKLAGRMKTLSVTLSQRPAAAGRTARGVRQLGETSPRGEGLRNMRVYGRGTNTGRNQTASYPAFKERGSEGPIEGGKERNDRGTSSQKASHGRSRRR